MISAHDKQRPWLSMRTETTGKSLYAALVLLSAYDGEQAYVWQYDQPFDLDTLGSAGALLESMLPLALECS